MLFWKTQEKYLENEKDALLCNLYKISIGNRQQKAYFGFGSHKWKALSSIVMTI